MRYSLSDTQYHDLPCDKALNTYSLQRIIRLSRMYQNEAGTQPFISESVLKDVGCKKVGDVVPDIELHVGPDEQTVERLSVALPVPVGAL